MTSEEIEYIQLIFQIHSLISEAKDSEENRGPIQNRMEVLEKGFDPKTQSFLNTVSSYCYALTLHEGTLKERYKRVLFMNTTDPDKLTETFVQSQE